MTYTVTKKTLLLGSLLLSSLIFAGCSTKQPIEQQPIQPTPVVEETQTPTPEVEAPTVDTPVDTQTSTTTQTDNPSYTLQDIQNHNTRIDCRTSINGKVYNLNTAFGKHEGGDDALALLCGIEGTAKFNTQHGTNEKSKSRLNTLQIGTLK
ncbi:MAG: cytochrome b5-like heme/steroid binding domain-containing protein [Candidatus Absconditicoccaceae bacterium]